MYAGGGHFALQIAAKPLQIVKYWQPKGTYQRSIQRYHRRRRTV